jgi:DNA-binding transcriptional MerR regulator
VERGMQMRKKLFRIGELAKELRVKKFVIRFWEKEFNLSSTRTGGGQRLYSPDDLELFKKIKDLLYNKKFTIQGAKAQLNEIRNFIINY